MACYGDSFSFIRTSQETPNMQMIFVPLKKNLCVSTVCFRDIINVFYEYVDNIRTSQETQLLASTAHYRDIFTLSYVGYVRTSQEAHLCGIASFCLQFSL
jgi:hypothetical protein